MTNRFDRVDTIGRSTVQHGPSNNRVYLMKLDAEDLPGIVPKLHALCRREGYTKVFAKLPSASRAPFDEAGYREEARIPRFYAGSEDAVFLCLYLDPDRASDSRAERVEEVLDLARAKAASPPDTLFRGDEEIVEAGPGDAQVMSEIYRAVFDSYPFPIHDPDYLVTTMRSHVRYFCALREHRTVAVSSAEIDRPALNVEMTDFATLPEGRGRGLALRLLATMERETRRAGLCTAYTIARSLSASMNITFARLGYQYAGTLVNNTDISGSIESMNVWHKPLAESAR